MTKTEISVESGRVRLRHGLLRAQQVASRPGWTRVGLVATTALLLGGDRVELEVSVGPGARLDLFDVAGTVAYDGRGSSATWRVRVSVAGGGTLVWSGEPFIVADGADVERSVRLDLDPAGSVVLRETLVLGRTGERGGRLRNRTEISQGGRCVLFEDQQLDPGGVRTLPGVLGELRVIDTVMQLGPGEPQPPPAGAARFRLFGGSGTITRFLGHELADSPLNFDRR